VEILIWGSDFAHATGDWPNSQKIIGETFAGVDAEERHKMVMGNVVRFFKLDGAADLDAYGRAMPAPAMGQSPGSREFRV
jgi:hypothetical protein